MTSATPASDEPPIRVAVFGAAGRMGTEVCRTVTAEPGLELVAAFDPHASGERVGDVAGLGGAAGELTVVGNLDDLNPEHIDVAVDFTVAEAGRVNVGWCAHNAVHAVVGTTGFSEGDLKAIESSFTESGCVIAPNFAISAVLLMRLAAEAAPYFDSVEIIELHHDAKRDAPSGTALATAERISASSSRWSADPTEHEVLPGARGGRGPGGIPIHAVRLTRPGGPSGSAFRDDRPVADDSPGLIRSHVLHAWRGRGDPGDDRAAWPHVRIGPTALRLRRVGFRVRAATASPAHSGFAIRVSGGGLHRLAPAQRCFRVRAATASPAHSGFAIRVSGGGLLRLAPAQRCFRVRAAAVPSVGLRLHR